MVFFFFQAEDGIRDVAVTGVQTCALPILFQELSDRLDKQLAQLGDLETTALAAFNRMLRDFNVPAVGAGGGKRGEQNGGGGKGEGRDARRDRARGGTARRGRHAVGAGRGARGAARRRRGGRRRRRAPGGPA